MKATLRLILVLSLLLMLSTPVSAQSDTQSPEDVVLALYDATNAGDIEAYMALLADDAVATVGPWQTLTSRDEIRPYIQENMDANADMEFEIQNVANGLVTVWTSLVSEEYDFPLEAIEKYIVDDGKIIYNAWDPTADTMALLSGPAPAAEEIVAAAFDAINAADMEAYMSLFAEDAVYTIGPWQTLTNHDDIRSFVQENFDAGAQMEYQIESVDNGMVTVRSSLTSEAYDFPMVAIEKFVVDDGKIIYNPWDPTEETMALLAGPGFSNDTLNGVYGIALDGVFLATEDDPSESDFSMAGAFVADGEGNISGGTRTLNLGGELQTDTFDGTYVIAEEGTATITLNAYQDNEQVATEELACFITVDGSELECIVSAISVPAESGAVAVPLVGSAHGQRLTK